MGDRRSEDGQLAVVRPAGDGWAVVTHTREAVVHRSRPCPRCPWRRDAPVGAFPTEAYRLSAPMTYDLAELETQPDHAHTARRLAARLRDNHAPGRYDERPHL